MPSKAPCLLGLAALSLGCPIANCYVPNPRRRSSGRRGGGADHNIRSSSKQQRAAQRQDEIILPPPKKPTASVEESTFWRSVPERQRPKEDEIIPCQSNLDADGPLPFGAYRTYGNQFDPARTCLLTVALDFTADEGRRRNKKQNPKKRRQQTLVESMVEGVNVDSAVRNIQTFIDAGFTSFQVADDTSTSSVALQEWADERVFNALRRVTPSSVLHSCNFSTKIAVPPICSAPFGSGSSIREAVGASLRRTGADCIDTVQVPYCKDSPYHLDVLNVLSEMQQEGFIRAVGGLSLPPSILAEAEACNFHLDTNQVECSLLGPQTYVEYAQLCREINTKMLCGSPLAGGLLTDKYLECERRPKLSSFSPSELRNIEHILPVWVRRNGNDSGRGDWEQFHETVLKTIGDIAYKHQVSAATVALRWSLHLDNLGSVVIGSRVGKGDDDERPFGRPRALRNAFTFELDEEDMQRLWDVTGCSQYYQDAAANGSEFGENGYIPDLSNRKLWL